MKSSTFIAPSLSQKHTSMWKWVPLLFSAFYFLPFIMNSEAFVTEQVIGIVAIYVAFIFFYVKGQYCTENTAGPYVLATLLLCFIGTYFTPGTFALYAFVTYYAGYFYRFPKSFFYLLATLAVAFISGYWFNWLETYFVAPILFCCLPNYLFGVAERKSRYHQAKEQKSEDQIEHLATVAERERIARDLHDVLGHALASIALKAELSEKLLQRKEYDKAQKEVSDVATITRQTLSEMRAAVAGYKYQSLEQEISSLEVLINQQGFTLNSSLSFGSLSSKAESEMLMIIKEAVTNIIKHAIGKTVTLTSKMTDDTFSLYLHNDGEYAVAIKGNGLHGIEERTKNLGGQCQIDTSKGFEIKLDFNRERIEP